MATLTTQSDSGLKTVDPVSSGTEQQTVWLKEMVITPTLLGIAQRYMTDLAFRQHLDADPLDALSQAEILLTPSEFETLVKGLKIIPGAGILRVNVESFWCIGPNGG